MDSLAGFFLTIQSTARALTESAVFAIVDRLISFRAGFRLAILGMDAAFLFKTYWYLAFVLLVFLTVLICRKLLSIRKRRLSTRQPPRRLSITEFDA